MSLEARYSALCSLGSDTLVAWEAVQLWEQGLGVLQSIGVHASYAKPGLPAASDCPKWKSRHSCSEQGIKLLGLLLTGSTGQRTASRNGLA